MPSSMRTIMRGLERHGSHRSLVPQSSKKAAPKKRMTEVVRSTPSLLANDPLVLAKKKRATMMAVSSKSLVEEGEEGEEDGQADDDVGVGAKKRGGKAGGDDDGDDDEDSEPLPLHVIKVFQEDPSKWNLEQVALLCHVLDQYHFFAGMQLDMKRRVVLTMKLRTVSGGTWLIKQGEQDNEGFYLILSGKCAVYRHDSYELRGRDGDEQVPPWEDPEFQCAEETTDEYERQGFGKRRVVLNLGDSFGEVALRGDTMVPRNASVLALSSVVNLIQIPRTQFQETLQAFNMTKLQRPDEIGEILNKAPHTRTSAEVLTLVDWLRNTTYFKALPAEVCMKYSEVMKLEKVPGCKMIIRQGSTGKKFYVILKGKVGVHINNGTHSSLDDIDADFKKVFAHCRKSFGKKGKDKEGIRFLEEHPPLGFGKCVSILRVGDSFGERALVDPYAIRQANIFTCEDTEVLTCTADEYQSSLDEHKKKAANRKGRATRAIVIPDSAILQTISSTQASSRTKEDLEVFRSLGSRTSLVQQLSAAEQRQLYRLATVAEFGAGDVVYAERDLADAYRGRDRDRDLGDAVLYIVVQGSVAVHRKAKQVAAGRRLNNAMGKMKHITGGSSAIAGLLGKTPSHHIQRPSSIKNPANVMALLEASEKKKQEQEEQLRDEQKMAKQAKRGPRKTAVEAKREKTYGTHLCDLRSGDAFGEQAMVQEKGSRRHETVVVTSTRLVVFQIKRSDYLELVAPERHRHLVFSPSRVMAIAKMSMLDWGREGLEEIVAWLESVPFFRQFPPAQLPLLAKNMQCTTYSEGDVIFNHAQEGRVDDVAKSRKVFTVVLHGAVLETADAHGSMQESLLHAGDTYNDIPSEWETFMRHSGQNRRHRATTRKVVAQGDAAVCTFARPQFAEHVLPFLPNMLLKPAYVEDYLRLPVEERNTFSTNRVVAELRRMEMFRFVSSDTLRNLAMAMSFAEATLGEVIVEQGSVADRMYLILRGSVDVRVMQDRSPSSSSPLVQRRMLAETTAHRPSLPPRPEELGVSVCKLTMGDAFGEQGLMYQNAIGSAGRSASILSSSPLATFAVISAHEFRQHLGSLLQSIDFHPRLNHSLLARMFLDEDGSLDLAANKRELKDCVRRHVALQSLPEFNLAELCQSMKYHHLQEGDELLAGGTSWVSRVYIVLTGQVKICSHDTTFAFLAEGDTVGEIPSYYSCAAPFNIRCCSKGSAISVPRAAYNVHWRPWSKICKEADDLQRVSLFSGLTPSERAIFLHLRVLKSYPRRTHWVEPGPSADKSTAAALRSSSNASSDRAMLRILLAGECTVSHRFVNSSVDRSIGVIGPVCVFCEDEVLRVIDAKQRLSSVDDNANTASDESADDDSADDDDIHPSATMGGERQQLGRSYAGGGKRWAATQDELPGVTAVITRANTEVQTAEIDAGVVQQYFSRLLPVVRREQRSRWKWRSQRVAELRQPAQKIAEAIAEHSTLQRRAVEFTLKPVSNSGGIKGRGWVKSKVGSDARAHLRWKRPEKISPMESQDMFNIPSTAQVLSTLAALHHKKVASQRPPVDDADDEAKDKVGEGPHPPPAGFRLGDAAFKAKRARKWIVNGALDPNQNRPMSTAHQRGDYTLAADVDPVRKATAPAGARTDRSKRAAVVSPRMRRRILLRRDFFEAHKDEKAARGLLRKGRHLHLAPVSAAGGTARSSLVGVRR